MSYKDRNHVTREASAPPSYTCPAHGCPNAASVSFDHGSRWACYFHAKEAANDWPAVTDDIRNGWPAKANWNHPEKVSHEAEQAQKRRAKLPPKRGPVGGLVGLI